LALLKLLEIELADTKVLELAMKLDAKAVLGVVIVVEVVLLLMRAGVAVLIIEGAKLVCLLMLLRKFGHFQEDGDGDVEVDKGGCEDRGVVSVVDLGRGGQVEAVLDVETSRGGCDAVRGAKFSAADDSIVTEEGVDLSDTDVMGCVVDHWIVEDFTTPKNKSI